MKDLPDKLDWLKFTDVSWTTDNKGFFYNVFDVPEEYAKTGKPMDEKAG